MRRSGAPFHNVRHRKKDGFLLLELVVSLAVLACLILIIAQCQWQQLTSSYEAQDRLEAVTLAQSLLEESLMQYKISGSETRGKFTVFYDQRPFSPVKQFSQIHPVYIDIKVTWKTLSDNQRSVVLTSAALL
jgi:Tfp pilus assembly protein PilV